MNIELGISYLSQIRSKFGKDILKYLPSRVVPALIGLIAIPIITRLFEPKDYGYYVLVITTVAMLSLITTSLLGNSTIRFFPEYEQQAKLVPFYGTLKTITIAGVMGIAIIFFGTLQLLKSTITPSLYSLMSIGVLLFIVTAIFAVWLHLLNARQKAIAYSSFCILQVGVGLAVGVAIVWLLGWGVDGLLWGAIGAVAIALPFLYRAAFSGAPAGKSTFSKSIVFEMSKYGVPLIIANLAGWILSLSDRYVIGWYCGSSKVGIYSASYTISEQTLGILLSLFMLAGYPLIVSMWESRGKQATQQFVGNLTRYYVLIAFPAAVGLSVLARPIIGVFTASAYHEGYRIVPLIAFGSFLLGLQWWALAGLALHKRTSIIAYSVLGAGVLNISLNFWLVPRYGYMAAAVTTFIAYAFLLVLVTLASRRLFTWEFPFKSLGKVTLASAIMAGVVYPIGNGVLTSSILVSLILGIGSGIVVYFGVLLLLKEVRWNEILGMLKQKEPRGQNDQAER